MYLLSDVLAALQVMITVGEDLRLHNGDNAVLEDITKYKLHIILSRVPGL